MSYDQLFKIVIVGASATGKSCFLKYNPAYEKTIGVEFTSKIIPVEDKSIKLQIWDTSGNVAFLTICRSYIFGALGAILVYDITNLQSFENLPTWEKEVIDKDFVIVVGNKSDLESQRAVKYDDGMNYARERGFHFIETSCKTGVNVEEMYAQCALQLYKRSIEKNS